MNVKCAQPKVRKYLFRKIGCALIPNVKWRIRTSRYYPIINPLNYDF